MAKIDDLPPDLWPTWRWLHKWILRQGLKTDDFIRESGINPFTFKKVRDTPTRPLPFTDQWRRVVNSRDSIAARCWGGIEAGKVQPEGAKTRGIAATYIIGYTPAEIKNKLRINNIYIATVLRKSKIGRPTFNSWMPRGRIPDTVKGRAFVRCANELLANAETEKNTLTKPSYTGCIASPIPGVSPADILMQLSDLGISVADAAREAGVVSATLRRYNRIGYVSDTDAGRAFVKVAKKYLGQIKS